MGQLWVAKFRNQKGESLPWFYGWDGATTNIFLPIYHLQRFRCTQGRSAGPLGSRCHTLWPENKGTLNEYSTKTIHVGQSVVFARKIEMLFPKRGNGYWAGNLKKTADLHYQQVYLVSVMSSQKTKKLCKDTSISLSHTHTQFCVSSEKAHLIWLTLFPFDSFLLLEQ